ncbi:MAG TPA: squalene/phytoene synthase family protein [Ktedonobacterales bacterium]|nr:squalene/phytoene synthase family protein [Ktedonobacterales bacterium]
MPEDARRERELQPSRQTPDGAADLALPARITKAASKQAYYTGRWLVDPDRRSAAYRAYAYFRWVDDRIDQPQSGRTERAAFMARQQDLIACARRGQAWRDLTREERLLVDLIRGDDRQTSGLESYISHMLAVMAFDASRRGCWVRKQELDQYTEHLAIAVTDALHYFIGHTRTSPTSASRYCAAMAAHITHMLRDTWEDVALGYFNVPRELLESSGIGPHDVHAPAYRAWVKQRVQLARSCFTQGAAYLDQLPSVRCRLAGYAYLARFAGVLDAIEREGYRIRPAYPEFTHRGYALRVGGAVVLRTLLRGTS